MSEKNKDKPKSKHGTGSPFLAADDSTFFYVTTLPVEQVIQALYRYETPHDDLTHSLVFTPVSLGYEFRYDIITPGIARPKRSAYALGQIRQDGETRVIVEGTIHIAVSKQDIVMIAAMSIVPIPFLLLLPIMLFTLAAQRNDARLLKSNIAQAAGMLDEKTKPVRDSV